MTWASATALPLIRGVEFPRFNETKNKRLANAFYNMYVLQQIVQDDTKIIKKLGKRPG
jgi:hypothetical protein